MAVNPVLNAVRRGWEQVQPLLLLAATATAEHAGISAAGACPESRRLTAAADAELLVLGPRQPRPHALPPLPAGVSPALIAHVGLRNLGLLSRIQVVDLGCPTAPTVPHLRLPGGESAGPAACVSSGRAMPPERVRALLERGRRWGENCPRGQPLLLAECVPGGTTTALAVLQGLGIAAEGLVSGSLREPAHALKARLVRQGLTAAGLSRAPDPIAVLTAVGDPMQVLAAGLVMALSQRGVPVLLAGGSQMAAVLAVALALALPQQRARLADSCLMATTAWVAEEAGSDLRQLSRLIGERWGVNPQLEVASLRFHTCRSQALRDYERGYVKEGVGAGGVAVLWELSGRDPADLARACDQGCAQLLDT
ncbi:MAG: TIGR00303 family protein [Cyanobacteriota bacterium]|nr:TIGR00303 family protein [Cyanobacteriota bacterium]